MDGESNTDTWESFPKPHVSLSFDAGFASFGVSYARALKEDNDQNRFILSASLPVGKDQNIPVTLKGKFGINDYTDNDIADDWTTGT